MRPEDVPAGPLALDTDVFSWLLYKRGPHAEFAPLIAGHPVALPFAVVGELKVGAIRGRLGSRRRAALEAHISACVVLPADARVVDRWAELQARFLDRLKRGGINDLWIAACCLVHGLPLVTGNHTDFETIAAEVPELTLVRPNQR